jgi:hypothetical protein
VQDSLDAPYDAAFAQFQKAQRQSQDDLHPNLRDPNRVEELQVRIPNARCPFVFSLTAAAVNKSRLPSTVVLTCRCDGYIKSVIYIF